MRSLSEQAQQSLGRRGNGRRDERDHLSQLAGEGLEGVDVLLFEHLQGGSPDLRDVRVGDGSSKRGDGGQLSPRLCSVGPHVTAKVVEAAGKSGDERLHLGGVDDEPREARCDVSLNVGVEGQGRVDRSQSFQTASACW